jgi:hypothetical protein
MTFAEECDLDFDEAAANNGRIEKRYASALPLDCAQRVLRGPGCSQGFPISGGIMPVSIYFSN